MVDLVIGNDWKRELLSVAVVGVIARLKDTVPEKSSLPCFFVTSFVNQTIYE